MYTDVSVCVYGYFSLHSYLLSCTFISEAIMAISKACYDIETSCDYDSGVEKYMQLCSSFF